MKRENLTNYFSRRQKMDYTDNLETRKNQCVADIGVLQSNLAEIDKEIEAKNRKINEVFFRGQWFKNLKGKKFLLTEVSPNQFALILYGNRWFNPVSTDNYGVTWSDLNRMHTNAFNDLTPIKVDIVEKL